MENNTNGFFTELEKADMILVGLGEDFELKKLLRTQPEYNQNLQKLNMAEQNWRIPFLDAYFIKKYKKELFEAYRKLEQLIRNKNYFMISTAMNETVYESGYFEEEKIVTPCGGYHKLQCSDGCKESLSVLTEEQIRLLEKCCSGEAEWTECSIGICRHCGKPLYFNNIYLEHYLEEGYLPAWDRYMKWTQGTLNKQVMVLELGVGLTYPNIIRWPFEKIAFFNQKASFYRVNETLYQMPEELQHKGVGIPRNAVDFLLEQKAREI